MRKELKDRGFTLIELMRERSYQLRREVKITDIYHLGKEKTTGGEATIRFFTKDYAQPTVIHLAGEGEKYFTLVLNPFLGSIKTYDRYIDFQNALSP
jgi:hypothetical protein